MSKKGTTLVIIESPGKIKSISHYLGPNYIVKASVGHVMGLDKSTMNIDIKNNFEPNYSIIPEKRQVVATLKKAVQSCNNVLLATDADREGEAIAWSLANILEIKNPQRLKYTEITKKSITDALEKLEPLDMNLVNAQQARLVLDRLVGYSICPLLWKYFDRDILSAGRVQSIVVKLVVERENEINKEIENIKEPKYEIKSNFLLPNKEIINATLCDSNSKTFYMSSQDNVSKYLKSFNNKINWFIQAITPSEEKRNPPPPFITSSLQQDAYSSLRFGIDKTMNLAKELYEGGHITYMRTDSPSISSYAVGMIVNFVKETFGEKYSSPRKYTSKNSSSQEAHECIRPTHFMKTEEMEQMKVSEDAKKLYYLIWKRTLQSQMATAIFDVLTTHINYKQNKTDNIFISVQKQIKFDGFMILNNRDEEKDLLKTNITEKTKIQFDSMVAETKYEELTSRYNEASMVKCLETNKIGRPSTFVSMVKKVLERKYVEIKSFEGIDKPYFKLTLNNEFEIDKFSKTIKIGAEKFKLAPTPNGYKVNAWLEEHFKNIMNVDYTAQFEEYLDLIADGKAEWRNIIKQYYNDFSPELDKLNSVSVEKTEKDRLLGLNENGIEVYAGCKDSPYIKYKSGSKWVYNSITIENVDHNNITLEQALSLCEYPKLLGKIGRANATICRGPFGFYLKCGLKKISLKSFEDNIDDIDLETAKKIIEGGDEADPNIIQNFKVKDKTINIKTGKYGPYIEILGDNKQNISIPKEYEPETITLEQVLQVIETKNGTKKTSSPFFKKKFVKKF